MENKRQKQVITWVMRCNTVVSPSGNINSNNYNNSNGVRPTWITGRQSKRKAEISKDTSKCITFPEWINIKEQKQWIIHELKEAEKKGAIVIVPAWNTSIDMDKVEFFPNRKMSKDKELTNLMIVASSDKKGNPVMDTNYGANTLDIYAPGTDIYSTYMGDTYRTGTGEGLAAATVAGVATLIKSYFPKLTGSQIRDILLKSVTSRKGVEVEKGIRVDDRPSQDLFLFDDLCISGGIVNAYQAILEAEKMNSQKK